MSLSRRQFIKASGVALCAGAVPLNAHAAGQQPALPVPPLLESRRGQPLFLTLQRAHWSFTPGTRASVWGVNGRYLGPTIRVWNGDDVKLIYSNRLTENVAMTIRGLQVPGPLIGGAARMMSPNADWAPVLPIRQSAATLWYQANTRTIWPDRSITVWRVCGWWKMKSAKTSRFLITMAWMTSR
mgnify:CR=1 FL=1